MTIATEIAALLNDRSVQSIEFTAESVRVDGTAYQRVAAAVLYGIIEVNAGVPMSDDEDGAYYDPINMLDLKVSAIATPYDKQVVVHEATHAALDGMRLTKSRGLHMTENEAISYIAEAVYVRNTGGERAGPENSRYARLADGIARKIIAARPHHYTVSETEMRDLRNAVGQDRTYRRQRGKLSVTVGLGVL